MEPRLRQKLMLIDNAVARLSSMKSDLRQNAEQVRRDIAVAVQHQIACLRQREQELLSQLDMVVADKEEAFSEQQATLSQAIGACQSGLECLRSDSEEAVRAVGETLLRLNAQNPKPRGDPHVAFEYDPNDLRAVIRNYGRIFTEAAPRLESLPMDMEEYDEDFLSHKSVMRLPRRFVQQSTIQMPLLTREKPQMAVDELSTTSNASSFEMVGTEQSFAEHITEIIKSADSEWLRSGETADALPKEHCQAPSMDAFRPVSQRSFEFVDVIKGIQQSQDADWLHQPSTSQDCVAEPAMESLEKSLKSRLSLSTPTISNSEPKPTNNNDTPWLQQSTSHSTVAFEPNWKPDLHFNQQPKPSDHFSPAHQFDTNMSQWLATK